MNDAMYYNTGSTSGSSGYINYHLSGGASGGSSGGGGGNDHSGLIVIIYIVVYGYLMSKFGWFGFGFGIVLNVIVVKLLMMHENNKK